MKPTVVVKLTLVLLCLALTLPSQAQRGKNKDKDKPVTDTPPADSAKLKGPYKPYNEVITAEAVSDSGVFTVHKVGDKYYYEIPNGLLTREFLLVSRFANLQNTPGSYGGEQINNENVVRWDRMDKKILLRLVSYTNVADSSQPIFKAVKHSNLEPVIMAFDIATMPEDSNSLVIEVTPLFTTDVPLIGLPANERKNYKVTALDPGRTFITKISSYPINIEARNLLTYRASEAPSDQELGSYTVEINNSMVLLPEVPMETRDLDWRVGWFALERTDYGKGLEQTETRYYTKRWRLEPKDPEAYARGELVEPVNPIVYYIDPATPPQWVPYLKQGVEDWKVAFERAGFKNAILAKDAPSPEEDPAWSPEDARYSVIRYFASPIQNAYGPSLADPRSGEILESDIGWYHNVMLLLRNWFFIQTSPYNPDAQKLDFAPEVMGQLIRFVAAHEVGHTLGLPHNMGSSHAVPVDSLRSASYTQANGICPSIMDYARFNYVRQPGDEGVVFLPRIGEYDKWSIEWGYRYFPPNVSREEQNRRLQAMVLAKAGNPVYFYGRQQGVTVDPRSQTEALGDDAMQASMYGIRNLKVIVNNLPTWAKDPGHNYEELQTLFLNVLSQWQRYAGHVAANVGGVYEDFKTWEQNGAVYTPTPAAIQKRAVQFLQEQYFSTPEWLLVSDLTGKFQRPATLNWLGDAQERVLSSLLSPDRLQRLSEAQALYGNNAYGLEAFFVDLRVGIWREANAAAVPDIYRRGLQRAYIERLGYLLKYKGGFDFSFNLPFYSAEPTPVDIERSEIIPTVRGELETLQRVLQRARDLSRDVTGRNHYSDLVERIDQLLHPKE